jgi:stage II sporulation protein R
MKKKHIWRILLFFTLMAMGLLRMKNENSETIEKNLKNNIIRFHVRAESDRRRDQKEKLRVRDAVIDYISPYMERAKTKEEAMAILRKEKKGIIRAAGEALKGKRKPGITVSYTSEQFPEKEYGRYVFPEGRYDALRVDIGKAEGHNWWCVMFPNLCMTKDEQEEINQKAEKKMERLLSKQTFHAIRKNKYFSWLIK